MRKALSAVTVFCLLGACVSCSNSAERDTSRKAVLDYSTYTFHWTSTPLMNSHSVR